MKKERKEALLSSFPPVPDDIAEQMCAGKNAANYIVFLTRGDELYVRGYHKYSKGHGIVERQRYVFAKDGFVRYGTDFRGKWSVRSEFREPVFCSTAYGYSFDNSYTALNLQAIKRSCMKYSMIEYSTIDNKGSHRLLIEYLRLYCKHPNIEYLLKSGYYPIEERVSGYWGGRTSLYASQEINWKSNNLLKMLNLNRTEFAVLKGSEGYYERYILWREKFPKMNPEDILLVSKVFGYETGTLQRLCESTGIKPPRLARYLSESEINTRDYSDYISQCRELGYDMHDTAISMPHGFQAIHERLSELIKIKVSDEARAAFKENYPLRKKLEYRFGSLFIRQPESMNEIVEEGSLLHHCVGGYAERHAHGKLHILFIRAADKPDVPYYTMELSVSGDIVQVRGLRNRDMTRKVKDFVEQYKKYIAEIFIKKEKRSA